MLSGKLTRIVVHVDLHLFPMSYMATTSMTKALSAISAMAELTVAGKRPTSDVVDVSQRQNK